MIAPIGANPVGEAGDPGDEAIVDGGRTFAQGQARGGAAGVPLHSLAESVVVLYACGKELGN